MRKRNRVYKVDVRVLGCFTQDGIHYGGNIVVTFFRKSDDGVRWHKTYYRVNPDSYQRLALAVYGLVREGQARMEPWTTWNVGWVAEF